MSIATEGCQWSWILIHVQCWYNINTMLIPYDIGTVLIQCTVSTTQMVGQEPQGEDLHTGGLWWGPGHKAFLW